jgi:hypothetical protein
LAGDSQSSRATHYEGVPVRCSPVQRLALASCSQVAAGGDRWLLMAVRGHLGGTRLGGSSSGWGVPPRWCREDPAASAPAAGWWKNRGGEPIDAGSQPRGAGSSPGSRRPGARRLPVSAGARRPSLVIGAKPAVVCRRVFTLPGAAPGDIPDDLVPGSGRSAGPGPPAPASSRRPPRRSARRARPGPTRRPRPRATLRTRRARPHPTAVPSRAWNLPGDRPQCAGDGPGPWPGSLPGPWLLARVLPEARC